MGHTKRGVDRRRSTVPTIFPLTLPSGAPVPSERRRAADRRRLGPLAAHPLFHGVDFNAIEGLAPLCTQRTLSPGEQLLSPGDMNRHLYLLLEGRLTVHIDRADAQEGFLIEAGEYTGEVSIIDGKPATAFVIAEQRCTLLAVPEACFWQDFLTHPRIAKNFMGLFAKRFRARNKLLQQALEERLRFERLQKELAIAREIQAGMLPTGFDLQPEVDLVAGMEPARHVGGDFYDVFPLGDDQYCIAIGDVSGKGVPAALFMVRSMTLLRMEMLKRPLEAAVQAVNVELCRENPRCMFVTLIVGVLHRRTGCFRYVRAGHNPVILGRRGMDFRSLPSPAGILAGVDEGASYEVASLTLAPQDMLVLYTDGITEAMNPRQELFGEARLLACLERARSVSAEELSERVVRAVEEFVDGAPPADDLTLMVLRYLGPPDPGDTG